MGIASIASCGCSGWVLMLRSEAGLYLLYYYTPALGGYKIQDLILNVNQWLLWVISFREIKWLKTTTQTYLKLSLLPEAAALSPSCSCSASPSLSTNFLSLYRGRTVKRETAGSSALSPSLPHSAELRVIPPHPLHSCWVQPSGNLISSTSGTACYHFAI